MDELLAAAEESGTGVLLGEENHVHATLLEAQHGGALVSNAVLASVEGHPFWRAVLDEVVRSHGTERSCGTDPVPWPRDPRRTVHVCLQTVAPVDLQGPCPSFRGCFGSVDDVVERVDSVD